MGHAPYISDPQRPWKLLVNHCYRNTTASPALTSNIKEKVSPFWIKHSEGRAIIFILHFSYRGRRKANLVPGKHMGNWNKTENHRSNSLLACHGQVMQCGGVEEQTRYRFELQTATPITGSHRHLRIETSYSWHYTVWNPRQKELQMAP